MKLIQYFTENDIDNVVFEGRNQNYGAYQLRQNYTKRLIVSLLLAMLCLVLLFVLPGLILKLKGNSESILSNEVKIKREEIFQIREFFIPSKPQTITEKIKEIIKPSVPAKNTNTIPLVVDKPVENNQQPTLTSN